MKHLIAILALMMTFTITASADDSTQSDWTGFSLEEVLDVEEDFDFFQIENASDKATASRLFKRRRWTCVVKNRRGRRFVGKSKRRHKARRRAMRDCRQISFRPQTCRVRRCRRKGGGLHHLLDEIF